MRIALFVPCYVDQLKPDVGLAALDVFDALGFETVYPEDQTCCGQPFLTAGEVDRGRSLGRPLSGEESGRGHRGRPLPTIPRRCDHPRTRLASSGSRAKRLEPQVDV